MPQRFGRMARMATAVSRQRMRAFDEAHPLPACARSVQKRRALLQRAGLLPEGEAQLMPLDIQGYLDDHGGSGLPDVTGVPFAHAAR